MAHQTAGRRSGSCDATTGWNRDRGQDQGAGVGFAVGGSGADDGNGLDVCRSGTGDSRSDRAGTRGRQGGGVRSVYRLDGGLPGWRARTGIDDGSGVASAAVRRVDAGSDPAASTSSAWEPGAGEDGDENRFEQEQEEFYGRAWAKYKEIAEREPGRVVAIKGELTIDEVHERVVAAVAARLEAAGF